VDPLGIGERASRLVDAPGDLGMFTVFLISAVKTTNSVSPPDHRGKALVVVWVGSTVRQRTGRRSKVQSHVGDHQPSVPRLERVTGQDLSQLGADRKGE
jgi:hypothetical protein